MANELQTKLDAILNDKNTNLLPEHLKAGVTCLGVKGDMETGIDTSDATATANDILSPKTAYINGGKITGSIIPQYSATKNILNIDCQGYINYTVSNDGLYLIYTLESGIKLIKLEDLSSTFISYVNMGIPENSYTNLAVSARNESNERYICVSTKTVNTPIYYALVNFNTFNVISNSSISLGLSQGRYAWKTLGNSTVNHNILYVCGLCNNDNSFVSIVNLSTGNFTNRIVSSWFSNIMIGANDDYVLVNFTQDMFWLDEEGDIYDDNGTTFKNYLLNTEAKLALNTSNGNVYNYTVDYENKKLTLGDISFNINTKWGLPLGADKSESAFIKKNIIYLNGYGYYRDGQLLDVNTSTNYYNDILCKNICKADIELAIPSKILTNYIDIYTSSEHSEIIGLTRGTKQYLDTSDATATANDIVQGATAYANGEKIEGNLIFASTLDNRNEDETVKNQPFVQVYNFNGETYFDMNVEASRMRGDMEYVDRAALDLNDSGGHNLVIAIGDKASNVANAIGLTSDKIVSGNTILGVEGTAEAGGSQYEEIKLSELQVGDSIIGIRVKGKPTEVTDENLPVFEEVQGEMNGLIWMGVYSDGENSNRLVFSCAGALGGTYCGCYSELFKRVDSSWTPLSTSELHILTSPLPIGYINPTDIPKLDDCISIIKVK